MENTREIDPSKPEIIRLNQEFQLFNPSLEMPDVLSGATFIGPIAILEEPGVVPSVPICLLTELAKYYENSPIITPLNPDNGYKFTNDDLDPKKRFDKIKARRFDFLSNAESFFLLEIHTPDGFKEKNKEITDAWKRIKIQLFFPWGAYEGRASNGSLTEDKNGGELDIESFYPSDTGPLPYDRHYLKVMDPFLHRGYFLGLPGLPEDREKLWQIKAKFVLERKAPKQT
jgi:hypothetical protein